MEILVQLYNQPYSPDLRPCDFFLFTLLKKISLDVGVTLKVLLAVPFLSAHGVFPKKTTYLQSVSGKGEHINRLKRMKYG